MDTYEQYEYIDNSRQGHRGRPKIKAAPAVKRKPVTTRAELTDFNDNVEEFVPSYAAALDPRHHERRWIIESLGGFYQDNIITDVTRLVKGGKEANVYCCPANPQTGVELIAAKLYRPRMLRNLKNDALYKEGRILRGVDGKELRGRRENLAMAKKTRFGQDLDISWWIGNEYRMQQMLHAAGADVPMPIAQSGNTILMAYLGDEWMAAPTLNEVSLPRDEAQPLFERVMWNVELMLNLHHVHGDLSAYNVLYWEGEIALIDFPQVVDVRTNAHAADLLERDVRRVCEYFGRYRIQSNPTTLAADLWHRYMSAELGV
jgi:RIO kinase 1